jgi:ankyrin
MFYKLLGALIILVFCFSRPMYAQERGWPQEYRETAKMLSGLPPIENLVTERMNANIKGADGITPLMLSAIMNRPDQIEALIGLGAALGTKDKFGRTAAAHALEWGSMQALKKLVLYGAISEDSYLDKNLIKSFANSEFLSIALLEDVKVKSFVQKFDKKSLNILLVQSAASKDLELVKLVIDLGAKPITLTDKGYYAIHMAARAQNPELVSLLLKNGANINQADALGLTPLHYSLQGDNAHFVQFLVDNGAAVEKQSKNGYAPIQLAIDSEYPKSLGVLLAALKNPAKYIDHNFLLQKSLNTKKPVELLQVLLKFGANPDIASKKSIVGTPLHSAIQLDEYEVIKILVDAGANINERLPSNGETAAEMIRNSKSASVRSILP